MHILCSRTHIVELTGNFRKGKTIVIEGRSVIARGEGWGRGLTAKGTWGTGNVLYHGHGGVTWLYVLVEIWGNFINLKNYVKKYPFLWPADQRCNFD